MEDKKQLWGSVALNDILAARDLRVQMQNHLIKRYGRPIISFTLNIPGPIKVFDRIPEAFESGCIQILDCLSSAGLPVLHREMRRERTGFEALFSVDGDPLFLKRLMTELEERTAAARLFDIDVIRIDGSKVSREEIGLPPRSCLLCGGPAQACSRSRRHSVSELTEHIQKLLKEIGL